MSSREAWPLVGAACGESSGARTAVDTTKAGENVSMVPEDECIFYFYFFFFGGEAVKRVGNGWRLFLDLGPQ